MHHPWTLRRIISQEVLLVSWGFWRPLLVCFILTRIDWSVRLHQSSVCCRHWHNFDLSDNNLTGRIQSELGLSIWNPTRRIWKACVRWIVAKVGHDGKSPIGRNYFVRWSSMWRVPFRHLWAVGCHSITSVICVAVHALVTLLLETQDTIWQNQKFSASKIPGISYHSSERGLFTNTRITRKFAEQAIRNPGSTHIAMRV